MPIMMMGADDNDYDDRIIRSCFFWRRGVFVVRHRKHSEGDEGTEATAAGGWGRLGGLSRHCLLIFVFSHDMLYTL